MGVLWLPGKWNQKVITVGCAKGQAKIGEVIRIFNVLLDWTIGTGLKVEWTNDVGNIRIKIAEPGEVNNTAPGKLALGVDLDLPTMTARMGKAAHEGGHAFSFVHPDIPNAPEHELLRGPEDDMSCMYSDGHHILISDGDHAFARQVYPINQPVPREDVVKYVKALYRMMFDREIENERAIDWWVNFFYNASQLTGDPRLALVNELMASEEFKFLNISMAYQNALGRDGSEEEWRYWIKTGKSLQDIAAAVAASDEAWERAVRDD